jgi:3D (Asp-Asp-Asp) domain-containing protein
MHKALVEKSSRGASILVMVNLRIAIVGTLVLGICGCAGIRPPEGVTPVTRKMVVTGYCSCGKCCGWHRNWLMKPVYSSGSSKGKTKKVGITASGKKAIVGTIAADTSLYPFGTVMYIDGYGYGRVEDRGGSIKGNRIDLYFPSHHKALAWGKKTKTVKVWPTKKSKARR